LIVAVGAMAHPDNIELPSSDAEILVMFEQLVQEHGRNYKTGEFRTRLANFEANLRTIETLRKANVDASFNPNLFFDYTEAEMKAMRMPSAPSQALARSCLSSGVSSEREVARLRRLNAAPPTWDWNLKGKVTPVKNQQQCGSCWTFSTTGSIESAYAIKHGQLIGLSEQEIVDCSHGCTNEPPYGQVCNSGCGGGWPWIAMSDIMTWPGLGTEAQYPYTGETDTCAQTPAMVSAPLSNYTCLSGTGNSQDGPADETDMVNWCYQHGPLSIALDATPLMFYNSGVIAPPTQCSQTQLDHAILITGWGNYQSNGQTAQYWTVKNSWGTSWGMQGYFQLSRGNNMCGVAAAVTHPIVE